MAFPIEEASNKAEKRVAASLSAAAPLSSGSPTLGVPGEAMNGNSDAVKDVTTTPAGTSEDSGE